jgi:hypothetical protein
VREIRETIGAPARKVEEGGVLVAPGRRRHARDCAGHGTAGQHHGRASARPAATFKLDQANGRNEPNGQQRPLQAPGLIAHRDA